MEILDNSGSEPEITMRDGIRYIFLPTGMLVPIHDAGLYKAVGMLPPDTPDFELTETEIQAQEDAELYYATRQSVNQYIDEFRPASYADIESFLEELSPYLGRYMFDMGEVRIRLHNRLAPLPPQVFSTSDPEMYKLYADVGLSPVWIGDEEAPDITEE